MQLQVYFNQFHDCSSLCISMSICFELNTCVSSQRTSVTLLGRTRHVRLDKDGRKARSFGFAAFLQFGVAKDVLICALSQFRNKLTPCESAQILRLFSVFVNSASPPWDVCSLSCSRVFPLLALCQNGRKQHGHSR